MKCENCKKEFSSFNWYKHIEHHEIVLCDDCLTEALRFKIACLKDKIKQTEEIINKMK